MLPAREVLFFLACLNSPNLTPSPVLLEHRTYATQKEMTRLTSSSPSDDAQLCFGCTQERNLKIEGGEERDDH